MSDSKHLKNRRPLASRTLDVTGRVVRGLMRTSVTPDQISAGGIVAAAVAALLLVAAPGWPPGFLLAAVFIQLRLLANLLDGLVAVEGGRAGKYGPLWNEVPDRVEDTLILAGFGFALGNLTLGLWAALAAMACAYVRTLGGALGQEQTFAGPMAKQHRMAAITAGCVLAFGEALIFGAPLRVALVILWAVLLGSLLTAARRLRMIAAGMGQ